MFFFCAGTGSGDFLKAQNSNIRGRNIENAPTVYATVGPKHQKRDDANMGAMPLASAPKDRKIPSAAPLSFMTGTRAVVSDVRVGPVTADPEEGKVTLLISVIHIMHYRYALPIE